MQFTLIESRHAAQWHAGGFGMSATFHVGIIALVTLMAGEVARQPETPLTEVIHFTQLAPKEAPPEPIAERPRVPENVVVTPPLAKGFQVLVAPVDVPVDIPPIDLTRAVTDEADFSGRGVAGGVAGGVEGGVVAPRADVRPQAYFEFQVEKTVIALPGGAVPRYPEMLRKAGVEGRVLAQFVVDTTGRVEPGSFKVLQATHPLFADAVEAATPGMRFAPAETGGRKVRMVAQQPFEFTIGQP